MKKLMIIAAIALAAIASNAASLNWKWTSTLYDHANGDAAFNGTVYIVNYNSYSQQTVLNALLDGGDLADYKMSSYTTANGKGPSSPYPVIASDSSTFAPVRHDAGAGKDYVDFYYAALTTDGEGNQWVFLGNTQSAALQTADDTTLTVSLSASKSGFESKDFGSQGWYKMESVPEPTSGLLLLLGVAGLALKRKRA